MSRDDYKVFIDSLPINIALYKREGDGSFVFFDFNKKAEKTDEISKEDLYGKKVTEVYPGIIKMGLLDVFKRVYDTGETEVYDKAYYEDDRIAGWRKNTVSKLDDNLLMCIFEDTSNKQELEDRVREFNTQKAHSTKLKKEALQLLSEKSKYEALLKSATDAIFIMDYDGALLEYSDKTKEFLGYADEEMLNLTVFDWDKEIKTANDYRNIVEVLTYDPVTIERIHTRKDGTTYIASITASKIQAVGVDLIYCAVRDVTQERETQRQLIQQSKLAQMGEMISMIAHQWRQPLSSIASITTGLRITSTLKAPHLNDKEEFKHYQATLFKGFDDIEELVHSLSSTINDFRNFFKPNKHSEYIALHEPLAQALKILKPSLDSNKIVVKNECIKCKDKIKIYSNELMQVLLNILKNSLDNFIEKETKNPKITITYELETDKKFVLKICDNGGGIPKDILEKIFDPYFSTKNEKNGTGLGLYMSKVIIEEHHHGNLIVENTNEGICNIIKLNVGTE